MVRCGLYSLYSLSTPLLDGCAAFPSVKSTVTRTKSLRGDRRGYVIVRCRVRNREYEFLEAREDHLQTHFRMLSELRIRIPLHTIGYLLDA